MNNKSTKIISGIILGVAAAMLAGTALGLRFSNNSQSRGTKNLIGQSSRAVTSVSQTTAQNQPNGVTPAPEANPSQSVPPTANDPADSNANAPVQGLW